ncbi:MAG: glutamate--tRNA ligase family protein [Pirellulales bacterium]
MATPIANTLRTPIGRLAPSPTGTLHLGNARSFLLAWLSIRQQNGTLVLRIEDIDSPRVKSGAVQSTIDDLRWLGLDWDFGPDMHDGRVQGVSVTQSQRLSRYREVLLKAHSRWTSLSMRCTRSQIAQAAASAPHELGLSQLEGPIYPGTCRNRLSETSRSFFFSEADPAALRWAFSDGEMTWFDGLLGPQKADPSKQLGDYVIGRATGQPSYQLAVVVDDQDMGVDEVVRGDDLVVSTYRQLALLKHLGWDVPKYYHVPLVLDADGRRMAKRQGDSLSFFREQNESPQAIIGYLAYSLNLIPKPKPYSPQDLVGKLDWQRIPKLPTKFTGRFSF